MSETAAKARPDLLKTLEAAELLGVNARTLAGWRSKPTELPFLKLGGHFYYERRELVAYLRRSRVEVER
jgi:hypothetical protein